MPALIAAWQVLYSLAWKPRVGESTTWHTEFSLVRDGVTTVVYSDQTRVVDEVRPDGTYKLTSTSQGTKMVTEGREIKDDRVNRIGLVVGRLGNVVQFVDAPFFGLAARVAGFNCLVAPTQSVTAGESWQTKRAGSADGIPESDCTYTLTQPKTGEDLRVDVTFRESTGDRATGSGTWVLDSTTFQARSFTMNLKGFKTGLGELTSYRLTRTSP